MISELQGFCWDEIESIEIIDEEKECYDITLLESDVLIDEPNFIANDIVVHNCGMHTTYTQRKKGLEKYKLHPLMRPILGTTYGVMVYQEQVMKILNAVGDIPLIHCEKIRKAISKKKVAQFAKYKEMFIKNGQRNLGATEEYVLDLWGQIEAFADYGFNKSMLIDTLILSPLRDGTYVNKKIQDFKPGDRVFSVNVDGETVESEVVALHDHGILGGFEVTFDDGCSVTCSINHKFLTEDGQKSLKEILGSNTSILCDPIFSQDALENEHDMIRFFDGCDETGVVGLASGHAPIADTGRLVPRRIVQVVPVGKQRMYDLEVAIPTHNFLLTNGVVTSNSHSYAYSYISARQLWLMAHYPVEFYTACLMCKTDSAEIKVIKIDAEQHGIELAKIDINKSEINFSIKKDEEGKEKVFFGFSNLKKIGEASAQRIVEHQPYNGITDFIEKYGADGTVIKALVSLGVFCEPEDRLKCYKFVEYWKDWHKKRSGMRERFKETMERYEVDLKELLLEYSHLVGNADLDRMGSFNEEAYELWEKYFSEVEEDQQYNYKGESRTRKITVLKHFHEVKRKREQSMKNNQAKENLGEESPPSLETFNPNHCKVKINEDVEALMTSDPRLAEREYYGWQWEHDLERCEDYQGYTFEWLRSNIEGKAGVVEIQIKEVIPTMSKKGKRYYILAVEDANGQEEKVTIWPDDYERFKDELVAGNLMKMRVVPPEGNWTKYGFEAPPPHQRWTLPKNKFQDCRLALMTLPIEAAPPPEETIETTVEEDVAFLLEDL